MADHNSVVRFTKRHGRRAVVTVAGVVVILAGLALCVLPGPGMLTVAAGLAILATEYDWARRLLHRVRHTARTTIDRAKNRRQGADPTPPSRDDDRDAVA